MNFRHLVGRHRRNDATQPGESLIQRLGPLTFTDVGKVSLILYVLCCLLRNTKKETRGYNYCIHIQASDRLIHPRSATVHIVHCIRPQLLSENQAFQLRLLHSYCRVPRRATVSAHVIALDSLYSSSSFLRYLNICITVYEYTNNNIT